MKKGITRYLQYAVVLAVVVILLCGIFAIVKRLTGTSSTDNLSAGGSDKKTEQNIKKNYVNKLSEK